MKLVTGIIKPHMLDEVRDTLSRLDARVQESIGDAVAACIELGERKPEARAELAPFAESYQAFRDQASADEPDIVTFSSSTSSQARTASKLRMTMLVIPR